VAPRITATGTSSHSYIPRFLDSQIRAGRPLRSPVANLERDRRPLFLGGSRRQRSQRGGRPALFANHFAKLAGRHEQFDERGAALLRLDNLDLLRLVGQRAREDFDDVANGTHRPSGLAGTEAVVSADGAGAGAGPVVTGTDSTATGVGVR